MDTFMMVLLGSGLGVGNRLTDTCPTVVGMVCLMDDAQRFSNVDAKILEMIDDLRLTWGSCSAGLIARQLRLRREVVIDRCRSMRERGLITWTEAAGSLRRVESMQHRLYELQMVRALEQMANGEAGDPTQPAGEWARERVAEIVGEVWPEPAGDREAVGLDGEPGPDPAPQDGGSQEPEIRCEVCDRTFQTKLALNGHERSKAHVAAVAAHGST